MKIQYTINTSNMKDSEDTTFSAFETSQRVSKSVTIMHSINKASREG